MSPADETLVPSLGELGDVALAAYIAAGNRAAFELLMRRHNRCLYRLARATLRDETEAEDVLQDAYLSAYGSISRFRGEATLGTWLSRLVLNECHDRLRRQGRRDNLVPILSEGDCEEEVTMRESTGGDPEQSVIRTELRLLLERKLDELPEAFRLVFVLRCVEELSVEETAQCLGIPAATVRTRQFRARSLLRESLAQDIDLAERDVFEFGGERCNRIVARVVERLAVAD